MVDLIDFEEGDDRRYDYEHQGVKYVIQSHDPYGFYTIAYSTGGTTPVPLSGLYTALSEAKNAIHAHHVQEKFREENSHTNKNKKVL